MNLQKAKQKQLQQQPNYHQKQKLNGRQLPSPTASPNLVIATTTEAVEVTTLIEATDTANSTEISSVVSDDSIIVFRD